MKKKIAKRILLCSLVTCLICCMTALKVNALDENKLNKIISVEVESEVEEYAKKIAPIHFHALQSDFVQEDRENLYLGKAISIYNAESNEMIYMFCIINNSKIVALLQITKDQVANELNSSMSISFSNELDKLLNDQGDLSYKLVTNGNDIYAVSESNEVRLYQINPEIQSQSIKKEYSEIYLNAKVKTLSKLDICMVTINLNYTPLTRAVIGPNSYKTISVKGVSQGSHPWCWAATCAALINYYKGKSLTASQVANYVFPNNPEQGGAWQDVKKAYNHWGLTVIQTSRISFGSIKTRINNDSPMHLGLVKHSVALIGYEDWSNESILILLEPNGGVRKSVTLNSNGNFNYYLSGNNSWNYTRLF